jgi:hypothetical protein
VGKSLVIPLCCVELQRVTKQGRMRRKVHRNCLENGRGVSLFAGEIFSITSCKYENI